MSLMKAAQRAKRDKLFLLGPLYFGWINQNIPDPTYIQLKICLKPTFPN